MAKHKMLLSAAVLLLVVLILSVAALAAGEPDLQWWLIGGGPRVWAGRVSLSGGVGQGVAGLVGSGGTVMCSGFWCAPSHSWTYYPVYLPLVSR